MKNLILTLICFLTLQVGMNAQTQLRPGELLLLEVNKNEKFIFMPLVNLDAGTIIYFTDQAIDNNNTEAFSRTDDFYETILRYETPAGGIEAGTVIRFEQLSTPGFSQWGGDVIPYKEIRNGINISDVGDQLTAFQDIDPTNNIAADAEPRFLFSVNLASIVKNSVCSATDDNETRKPFGLFPVTYSAGDGPGSFLAMGQGTRCDDDSDYAIYNAEVYGINFSSMQEAYQVMADPDHWIIVAAGQQTRSYDTSLDILLNGMPILPVVMTSFVAKENDGAIDLTWRTSQEVNSDFFAVEHSTDGVDYQEISRVDASGQSTIPQKYTYTDNAPSTGDNYYRLRQVDLDGSFVYSEIKIVTIQRDFSTINIFPNPAINVVNVGGLVQRDEPTVIRIIGSNGATIMERIVSGDANLETFEVSDLARGFYFIQVISNTETITDKFIKF